MKSKIIFSVFILCVFISGAIGGFYAGIKSASGSMSSEIYSSSLVMGAALQSIENNETGKAKATLCRSIQTRLEILNLSKPILNDRKMSEISNFKQIALHKNINKEKDKLVAICI